MKNKITQTNGLGNKNLLSFWWFTQILKAKNVSSHMSIQYVNQSINQSESLSILDNFPIYREANGVSKESIYMCRQHETLDCRKLHKQLSNSCHRSGKGHVWQLNGILL
jgi:hypothetical protein